MLGLDHRTLRVAWTLCVFSGLLAAAFIIRHTVMIFALALFFSELLSPAVEFVHRYTPPRVSRTTSLAIVYLAFLGLLVALSIPLGAKIGEQAATVATKLPDALKNSDPLGRLPLPNWLEPARAKISELGRDRLEDLQADLFPLLRQTSSQILAGLGSILQVVLIPILAFFFLKDGPAIRAWTIQSFGWQTRPLVRGLVDDLHALISSYIRALITLALATFTSHLIFLNLIGVPNATLLAGIAAPLEVIPVVGPMIAAVSIILVAAFSGYSHVLWIVVFLGLYRLFQDYVLSPALMSAGVEVHPLLVLFGVLAGEQLAGIPGMFFSVPVIAVVRMVVMRLWNQESEA